ncbi:hypothetical protein EYR40_001929 [Pleurotus pulmonarius]|nr:hypothetical protein EYR40_001929 [Pleurotus pulmonarius]
MKGNSLQSAALDSTRPDFCLCHHVRKMKSYISVLLFTAFAVAAPVPQPQLPALPLVGGLLPVVNNLLQPVTGIVSGLPQPVGPLVGSLLGTVGGLANSVA